MVPINIPQSLRHCFCRKQCLFPAFTLIEVLVAMCIAVLVGLAAAGSFISLNKAGKRQAIELTVIEEACWAGDRISAVLRKSRITDQRENGDEVRIMPFRLECPVYVNNGSAGPDKQTVVFYRGDHPPAGVNSGNSDALYCLDQGKSPEMLCRECARPVQAEDGVLPLFSEQDGLVRINLSFSRSALSMVLTTQVRPRN